MDKYALDLLAKKSGAIGFRNAADVSDEIAKHVEFGKTLRHGCKIVRARLRAESGGQELPGKVLSILKKLGELNVPQNMPAKALCAELRKTARNFRLQAGKLDPPAK